VFLATGLFCVIFALIRLNIEKQMKNTFSVALLVTLLSGCGAEIAYKQGATAQDLQRSKAACQQSSNEKELNQCLEDNGWAVTKMDGSSFSDEELFASASVTEDNRMTAPKKEKPVSIQTTESLKSEEIAVKNNEIKADAPKAVSDIPKANSKETPSDTSAKPTPIVDKPLPSIFDTYVIKSWWKMGGNLTLLEKNMNECNEQLGEAHIPNKKTFTFTRGFAICMRQKGWRGLIEK
jgi:uncharacterized protein YceK